MSIWRHLTGGLRVLTARAASDQDLGEEAQHYLDRTNRGVHCPGTVPGRGEALCAPGVRYSRRPERGRRRDSGDGASTGDLVHRQGSADLPRCHHGRPPGNIVRRASLRDDCSDSVRDRGTRACRCWNLWHPVRRRCRTHSRDRRSSGARRVAQPNPPVDREAGDSPYISRTAIGLIGSVAGGKAVATLLFGVSPLDLATYFAMLALLLAVSAAACWVPAWRASRVDPAITLRAE